MSETHNSVIAVIGIDIGKNSFHVVGLDGRGAIALRQKWSRGQLEMRLANMPACLIGMEACVGAHHLNRRLSTSRVPSTFPGVSMIRHFGRGFALKRRRNDSMETPQPCHKITRAAPREPSLLVQALRRAMPYFSPGPRVYYPWAKYNR